MQLTPRRFIASAGTYANLVKQAKSKQKIIDKMEAAGLIEKIEVPKPLRFNFEDVAKLPTSDVLRAQLVGLLSAPSAQLAAVLSQASGGTLARTLEGLKKSLEEG